MEGLAIIRHARMVSFAWQPFRNENVMLPASDKIAPFPAGPCRRWSAKLRTAAELASGALREDEEMT